MIQRLSVIATAMLAFSGAAMADTYTFSGDTTGAPTYNRATVTFAGLSALGDAVNYNTLSFTVSASGSYDFTSAAGTWDNFIFLYSPSFDPNAALSNGVIANDDLGPIGNSGFTTSLTAGTSYVFVTTGFESGVDFGAYTNTITGPGAVITAVVPEPSTYALMALGVLAVGGLARRRAARATA